jgi:hypothetical protein
LESETLSDRDTDWSPAAVAAAESSEEDMDLDNEVPDTMIKKKSGGKQKKGLTVRGQIDKVAAELAGNPNLEVQKRKAGLDGDNDG